MTNQQQINEIPNGLKVGDRVKFKGKADGPYKVDAIVLPGRDDSGFWIVLSGPLGIYGATEEELELYRR